MSLAISNTFIKKNDMKQSSDISRMNEINEAPLLFRILPDALAFVIGLSLAWFLEWETTDLVWSLWLCSLVLGYLTLLSAIGGGAVIGIRAIRHEDFKAEYRMHAIFGGMATGIFFLGFFSFHFCGFHAGHSVFLRQFFPVEGIPEMGFGDAFMNPPLLWWMVFKYLMVPYGIFLIPAIIAERKHVFLPLMKAIVAVNAGEKPVSLAGVLKKGKNDKKKNPLGDAMGRPYINVVRMHCLIFFFAFCHAVKLDSFFIYAVVYFVYFSPWKEMKKLWDGRGVR
jgi:hypothetical protein